MRGIVVRVVRWDELVDWNLRSKGFGKLATYDDGRLIPVIEYEQRSTPQWEDLRALWLDLPVHRNLLEAVDESGDRGLWLRYPALCWPRSFFSPRNRILVASWGAQIADAYSVLLRDVGEDRVAHLVSPFVEIDIGGHPRLGFRTVKRTQPHLDERALVYVVGKLMSKLRGDVDDTHLLAVIDACCNPEPQNRYESLYSACVAFQNISRNEVVRSFDLEQWRVIEEAMGWLAVDESEQALELFELAIEQNEYADIAEWGRHHAMMRLGLVRYGEDLLFGPRYFEGNSPEPTRAWSDAEPEALRLEAARDFIGALDIYRCVVVDEANAAVVYTACARAHFESGSFVDAIAFARRALAKEPTRTAARIVLAKALLARRANEEALTEAERLIVDEPALGEFLRGKALFALGLLHDAREAFDRACTLDPSMLEAMLLRREMDRAISKGRRSVGSQGAIEVDLPPTLVELRDVLLSGNAQQAIAALCDPRYADEPDAQLMVARLFVLDRAFDRALAIYERLASGPHRHAALLGKAAVLLERGSAESALALFDLLCSETPTDADSSEGRARALEKLGRLGEAAAEYRRFVAIATSRSDLRVRVAQLWLEQHPL